jgi:hypothetical protein
MFLILALVALCLGSVPWALGLLIVHIIISSNK